MSGRLLDFSQYIGGADNVITVEMFPSQSKSYTYNFNQNISNFTYKIDYQSLLLDTVTYDRVTGLPNFADTKVVGYFDNYTNLSPIGDYVQEVDVPTGEVYVSIPADRYADAIFPSARENVVVTVVSVSWSQPGPTSEPDTNLHRYLILERWEPGVAAGDPGLSTNFIPMGVGAVTSVSDNATTDVLRANVAGTYNNISGLTNGEGTGAEFQFIVLDTGDVTVNITNRGTGYNVNDTIQVLDSNLGGSGAPNITITALAVS